MRNSILFQTPIPPIAHSFFLFNNKGANRKAVVRNSELLPVISQRGLPLFYPDEFVGVIATAFGFGENERLGGVLQLWRARENPQVVLIASAY